MTNLKQLFPRGSKSFFQVNPDDLPQSPEPQPTVLHRADGKAKGKESDPIRYAICVTAYRARSCDPDNLCAKYFIDALRYSGIIHDDRSRDITYQISEKKVEKKNQEKTLIEITYDAHPIPN